MAGITDLLFPDETPLVVVAPMAGVTDAPFRALCRQFGNRFAISEMLTSDTRLWHSRKSRTRQVVADEPGPRWVQIAGADPGMLAEAAQRCADAGADLIDINMGCPAKKVCNRAAGSALLADEALVGELLEAVVGAVTIPVTLKYRLGPDPEQINAPRIARIAEAAGVKLLSLHGRTRACRFVGPVNLDAIGEACAATGLPVLANGDITTPEQAAAVLEHTGASGIMIGRGAQGRPWLPAQVRTYLASGRLESAPAMADVLPHLVDHVVALQAVHGTHRIARKHIGWFLDANCADATELKSIFNKLESVTDQCRFIAGLQQRMAA